MRLKSGVSLAEYYYAVMLYQGLGVEKNQDQAVVYFRRAEEELPLRGDKGCGKSRRSCIHSNPGKLVGRDPGGRC